MPNGLIEMDDLVEQIAEALRESSGCFVAAIANQVLSYEVRYLEDDVFETEGVEPPVKE